MNPTQTVLCTDSSPAAQSASAGLVFLTTSLFLIACSHTGGSRNESYRLLRSVPVPVSDVATSSLELDLEDGQVLRQQTYTISPEGEFTLNRLIESEVGTVGATFSSLSPSHAERLDMEPFSAVYVRSVRSKGPFSRAGIRSRDAILSFGGEPVTSRDKLDHLVESALSGTKVAIEFNHDGEISTTTVEISSEARTESIRALRRKLAVLDDRARTGLKIVEIPEDIHSILRGERMGRSGLLILDMLPGGPAFFSDLRVRDFVVHVGEQPVSTLGDYAVALEQYESGRAVPFQALRDGRQIQTLVTLEYDATSSSGFNLLSLVKYKRKPEEREFSMVWEILFHSEKSYSVVKNDDVGRHTTSSNWGAFLDLLRYRRTPKKTQFDLLWILPITFRNDEKS